MGTYISVESVRRTSGVTEAQIDDPDTAAMIAEVEKEVPRKFNTVFVPTQRIDILDGDGTNRLIVDKNPLLGVRDLRIDGDTEDPANLDIYKESGYVFLNNEASVSKFISKKNTVVIKYLYGTVEHSTTTTELSSASVAGSDIVLAVDSETDFEVNDWVEIFGMDGLREAAQITATSTNAITVDKLILAHEIDSTVVKLEISENFTKIMNIIASISQVARVVGESASDIVGYDLGELHVQKGEPYTQWRETANQLIKERDQLYAMIGIRPGVS